MDIRRPAASLLALLALTLASPAAAQGSYPLLQDALGRKAVKALEGRGMLVTGEAPERVIAVSWEALERHAQAAPRLSEFLSAFDDLRKGRDPSDPTDSFDDLLGLPQGGLLTGALRDAVAAAGRRAAAVRALGDKRAALSKAGSLYRTPWGRELSLRTHADLGGDALTEGARELFLAHLASPAAPPAVAAHLYSWADAAGVPDMKARLEAALQAGSASPELWSVLERYLADQAALEQLLSASDSLSKADKGRAAGALFDDARDAAPALAKAQDIASRLKRAMEDGASDEVRLSFPEVHVRTDAPPPVEPGEKAAFSAAYWVEGVPQGRSAAVTELLLLDDARAGFAVVSRKDFKRASGGPYTVNIEAELPRSGDLRYRLILAAAGAAPLAKDSTVAVSDALDGLRAASAEAHWLTLSCRFKESAAKWEEVLSAAGGSKKKARERLADDARSALKRAGGLAAAKKELDESLDGARLYASKERCEYRTDRAERALKLLASLPAGCDQPGVGAELAALASITASRRALQEAFRAGVARAKDRESSCKGEEAASLYASSLALLDSDPDARCGEFEREHAAVRLTDLPRAAAVKRLSDAVEVELSNARRRLAENDPRGALKALLPLHSALRSLPDQRCWSASVSKAEELTAASGVALGPRGGKDASLQPDPVGPALAEARHDWEERQAQLRDERGAADSVQAPRSAGGER